MWYCPLVYMNGRSDINRSLLKVTVLITLGSLANLLHRHTPSPYQVTMANETETEVMSKSEKLKISDRIVSSLEVAMREDGQLLETKGRMSSKDLSMMDIVKLRSISQTSGSEEESSNVCQLQLNGNHQISKLPEDKHREGEESSTQVAPEGENNFHKQQCKNCNVVPREQNISLTFNVGNRGSMIFQNAVFQESKEEGSEEQTLINDSESEEEYEDAVDQADNAPLSEISKTSRDISRRVTDGLVSKEGLNSLVVNNSEIEYESHEEYQDAVEEQEHPTLLPGPKLNDNIIETIDTFMSVRHLSSLTLGEPGYVNKSDNVYIGNVSYDLEKVNLKQNMRMVQQLSLPQSPTSTSQESVEFRIVTREEWQAERAMNVLTPLKKPVRLVIVSHTAASPFYTLDENVREVRYIQRYHMVDQEWDDIGYNFLIGMDGSVFEGRGWDVAGAHTKYYNGFSIGVSFIGKFIFGLPTDVAMQAFHTLMIKGVALGHLAPDYKLHGACQLRPTLSPGEALYKEVMQWPHWAPVEETQ